MDDAALHRMKGLCDRDMFQRLCRSRPLGIASQARRQPQTWQIRCSREQPSSSSSRAQNVAALGPCTQLATDQLAHLRVAHSVVLSIVASLPVEERTGAPVLEQEFLEAIANDVVAGGYVIVDSQVP